MDQPAAGMWVPGPTAARLAVSAVQSVDVVQIAPEYLRMLVQQARETVGLAVRSGDEMVFKFDGSAGRTS